MLVVTGRAKIQLYNEWGKYRALNRLKMPVYVALILTKLCWWDRIRSLGALIVPNLEAPATVGSYPEPASASTRRRAREENLAYCRKYLEM